MKVGALAEAAAGALVRRNNELVRRAEGPLLNPRPLGGVAWHERLVARSPEIRAEWDRFVDAGGRLPLLDDLLGEPQGASEPWRAGLLVSRGRAVPELARRFPVTVAAALEVPGIRSALWSVLAPGAELHEHRGPNAGVLRYHLGVVSTGGAALQVGSHVVPYVEGEGILFDDTEPHAAWNRGAEDRVTLFLEVLRPLGPARGAVNAAVQALLSLDRRYRLAPRRAAEWDAALNHDLA